MRSEPNDQSEEGQVERRDEEREWWLTVRPLTLCLGVGVIVFLVSLLSYGFE
jgi:hypothetical protein